MAGFRDQLRSAAEKNTNRKARFSSVTGSRWGLNWRAAGATGGYLKKVNKVLLENTKTTLGGVRELLQQGQHNTNRPKHKFPRALKCPLNNRLGYPRSLHRTHIRPSGGRFCIPQVLPHSRKTGCKEWLRSYPQSCTRPPQSVSRAKQTQRTAKL